MHVIFSFLIWQLQIAAVQARQALHESQLAELQISHPLVAMFRIWFDGHFGTINGHRLGHLPSQSVQWIEVRRIKKPRERNERKRERGREKRSTMFRTWFDGHFGTINSFVEEVRNSKKKGMERKGRKRTSKHLIFFCFFSFIHSSFFPPFSFFFFFRSTAHGASVHCS